VHADHLGVVAQKHAGLVAVGICIPTGRVNPEQIEELSRLADHYGNGEIRFTIGQNAIIPNVPNDRVDDLLEEPLLKQFSPRPSPFVRGLVACVGTDYCNLALIETKSRAIALSQALKEKLGSHGEALSIHWSGCPAGCGNHQAADIGLRGFKTKIDGKIVDAVAIYVGGRTGPDAVAGREILETVPCDASLPDVVADLVRSHRFRSEARNDWIPSNALPAVANWVPVRSLASTTNATAD
jgi:ferredoxin-nitrite reductase